MDKNTATRQNRKSLQSIVDLRQLWLRRWVDTNCVNVNVITVTWIFNVIEQVIVARVFWMCTKLLYWLQHLHTNITLLSAATSSILSVPCEPGLAGFSWLSNSTCSGRELSGINGTWFLWDECSDCHPIVSKSSKHWRIIKALTAISGLASFFLHPSPYPDGEGIPPFMPAFEHQ